MEDGRGRRLVTSMLHRLTSLVRDDPARPVLSGPCSPPSPKRTREKRTKLRGIPRCRSETESRGSRPASRWPAAGQLLPGSWTAHVPQWPFDALRDAPGAFLGYPLLPAGKADLQGVIDGP